jgi:uncharacterized protein YcaQ
VEELFEASRSKKGVLLLQLSGLCYRWVSIHCVLYRILNNRGRNDTGSMETLDLTQARRLALVRAGLLKPEWTGMPRRATGLTRRARRAAHKVIARFGYLQLDTVAVAGARSHAIVLLSRLEGFDPALAEALLQPGEPLFEYWGHEACWLPIDFYPVFAFRRQDFQEHPWWGDLIGQHPRMAADLTRRIREEGPLRSLDLEGRGSRGWWDLKIAKRMATALWSSGVLAIRERCHFQRVYDLTERVIPARWRKSTLARDDALEFLLLQALQGHGWATTGTLTQTWRLRNVREAIQAALARLRDKGAIVACALRDDDGRRTPGWVRPQDLDLADRLKRVRPRKTGAFSCPPSIRCCGIARACAGCLVSTRCWRFSNRPASAFTATTVCRCWPVNAWWRGSISRRIAKTESCISCPTGLKPLTPGESFPPPTAKPCAPP